ncbi:hypothetical protein B0T20DRAFT_233436 [Sordaria brevicollis]|uniref:Uncharacterized protein n=1 Tax=Sordaria brevicollis TaxID=83679 RepID=A0AAE0PDK9_SORBR|nr:hypothetical protein B0T20DRAFT_233436 [Sordaria brevicollis]
MTVYRGLHFYFPAMIASASLVVGGVPGTEPKGTCRKRMGNEEWGRVWAELDIQRGPTTEQPVEAGMAENERQLGCDPRPSRKRYPVPETSLPLIHAPHRRPLDVEQSSIPTPASFTFQTVATG